MSKIEIIKTWRRRLKEEFGKLANLARQKKIWIERKNPNIWWEWNETVDDYYNILSEKNKDESTGHYTKEGFITHKEALILRAFNKIFSDFSDKTEIPQNKKDYMKLLSDSEWIKIAEMAKDILQKIDFDNLP